MPLGHHQPVSQPGGDLERPGGARRGQEGPGEARRARRGQELPVGPGQPQLSDPLTHTPSHIPLHRTIMRPRGPLWRTKRDMPPSHHSDRNLNHKHANMSELGGKQTRVVQ